MTEDEMAEMVADANAVRHDSEAWTHRLAGHVHSLAAAVRERDARIEAFKKAWLEWHTIYDANMCVTDELIEAAWALVGGTK